MTPSLQLFRFHGEHLSGLQAHSSLHAHELPACHPQIAQCKQRDQLRRVLGQPFVAHPGKAELTLDDPKRALDLGMHTGLELFGFIQQRTPLVCLSSARRLPGRIATCQATPVAHNLVVAPWYPASVNTTASLPCSKPCPWVTSLRLAAVPKTVCTKPESASTPIAPSCQSATGRFFWSGASRRRAGRCCSWSNSARVLRWHRLPCRS